MIMKKKSSFMVLFASLLMASCSNEEIVEINKGHAIDFRTFFKTRAQETTVNNLEKFNVTALKNDKNYFTNATFTKEGVTSIFSSSTPYFWPTDGSNLLFFAYAPTSLEGNITITNSEQKLNDFEPNKVINDQVDFITAKGTGSKEQSPEGVNLQFHHRLSQIQITAKNENSNYVYKVRGIRIAKAYKKGSYDLNARKWDIPTSESEIQTIYETTYDKAIELNSNFQSLMSQNINEVNNAMLIPQKVQKWDQANDKLNTKNGAYISVYVNICTKDGLDVYPVKSGSYAWVSVPVSFDWIFGNKYVYQLDFTKGAGFVDPTEPDGKPKPGESVFGEPIKFNVSVEQWNETNQNVNM